MKWNDFIFSTQLQVRVLRHFIFWAVWWLYFSISFYYLKQPPPDGIKPMYVTVGAHIEIKIFLLVILYAIATYRIIYFVLPNIISGKWIKVIINITGICLFLFIAGYYMYWKVFPFVDSLYSPYKENFFVTKFWPPISLGLLDPLKVFASAVIIKHVKYTWLKQMESEKTKREKITLEFQLLKAQIRPDFLFNSLNNIYDHSLNTSPFAPVLLLKLSDLLSYMLYECDQPLVSLEKEIEMMKDYMSLEKSRLSNLIDMEVSVKGKTSDKKIASFLILPFIENSFNQSMKNREKSWINLDINVQDNLLHLKLANSICSNSLEDEEGLLNIKKRLALIYPQHHDLKINTGPDMQIVILKIPIYDDDATKSITDKKIDINNQQLGISIYAAKL